MKPLLNLDEPVQRRSGEPARIIERNAMGVYPVVALVTLRGGIEQVVERFTLRGEKMGAALLHCDDLINVPKRVLEGSVYLQCFLMEDGTIEVYQGSLPRALEESSAIVGAKAFRLVVKRGDWII